MKKIATILLLNLFLLGVFVASAATPPCNDTHVIDKLQQHSSLHIQLEDEIVPVIYSDFSEFEFANDELSLVRRIGLSEIIYFVEGDPFFHNTGCPKILKKSDYFVPVTVPLAAILAYYEYLSQLYLY